MARLGTLFAMRHFVFGTFVPAGLADVCAKRANRFSVDATPGHGSYSQCANLGAIHVQGDALGHYLDVRFMQAGSSAMVASHGAGVASLHAGVERLMRHEVLQKLIRGGGEVSCNAVNAATHSQSARSNIKRAGDSRRTA